MSEVISTELRADSADFQKGFAAATQALARFQAAGTLAETRGNLEKPMKKNVSVMRSFTNELQSAIGGFSLAAAGLAGLAAGGLLIQKSLKSAGSFEQLTVQFKVLLGSAEAAQNRMAELADFAQKTPFELPNVAKASVILETLTKGALSTGAGLTLVGDAAAATGQDISEIAIWFGRLYDGLQSGRPVGEALMRLQELGLVSGTTRTKIEDLQKAGKSGAEIWNVARDSFSRFSGSMEQQSTTLLGRVSNLMDAVGALPRAFGQPISDAISPILADISANMDAYSATAKKLGEMVVQIGRFFYEHRTAVLVVGGAYAALKIALTALKIYDDVTGIYKRIAAVIAETAAVRANTAAQLANKNARGGGIGGGAGGGTKGGGTSSPPVEAARPFLDTLKKGASAIWEKFKGFLTPLLARAGSIIRAVGSAVGGGVAGTVAAVGAPVTAAVVAGAAGYEKSVESTSKLIQHQSEIFAWHQKNLREAKTQQELEQARVQLAAQIGRLKQMESTAIGSANREQYQLTINSLKSLDATAQRNFELRDQKEKISAAAAAEKGAADQAQLLWEARVKHATEIEQINKRINELQGKNIQQLEEELKNKPDDAERVQRIIEEKKALQELRGEVANLYASAKESFYEKLLPSQQVKVAGNELKKILASGNVGSREELVQRLKTQEKSGDVEGQKASLELLNKIFAMEEKVSTAKKKQKEEDERKVEIQRELNTLQQTNSVLANAVKNGDSQEKIDLALREIDLKNQAFELAKKLNIPESQSLAILREKSQLESKLAEQEKAKSQGSAAADFGAELKALQLRVQGRTREAQMFEKMMKMQREAKQLAEQTGISEKQALDLVQKKNAMEDALNGKKNTPRPRGVANVEESRILRAQRLRGGLNAISDLPAGGRNTVAVQARQNLRNYQRLGEIGTAVKAGIGALIERGTSAQERTANILGKLGVV